MFYNVYSEGLMLEQWVSLNEALTELQRFRQLYSGRSFVLVIMREVFV